MSGLVVLVQKFHSLWDVKWIWVLIAYPIAIAVLLVIVTHIWIIIIQRRIYLTSASWILWNTIKEFPLDCSSFTAKMINWLRLIIVVSTDIFSLIVKDLCSGFLELHHITIGIIVVVLSRDYLRSFNHGFV